VGPRTRPDDVEKRNILPLPGLEIRPLGRSASRYTDYDIPAPSIQPSTSYFPKIKFNIIIKYTPKPGSGFFFFFFLH
jgi:hypothetical protein